jgi:hypothetical protein
MATSTTHRTSTRVSITPPANHPSSFVHATTAAGYVPQLCWHFLTSSFQHFYELLCILAILFRKECMSLASCTCPACSPNAMHIILHSSWEVIIDHHPEFRQLTVTKGCQDIISKYQWLNLFSLLAPLCLHHFACTSPPSKKLGNPITWGY